jgi:UDP-glucose 4-epimerase
VKWAMTGSGGYIGAHLLQRLIESKQVVLPLSGQSEASKKRLDFLGMNGIQLDLMDSNYLQKEFLRFQPDIVVHLASLKSPEESNRQPKIYLDKNVGVLKTVYEAAQRSGARVFIHASSSSVYGNLDSESIRETDECLPISAYGLSKKIGEEIIDSEKKTGISAVSLRFFNVIGASNRMLGETANFHLVPATVTRIKSGESPLILGMNLPTPDGTALRDYIHVCDAVESILKSGHVLAENLSYQNSSQHLRMNIGSGKGVSVLEIVKEISSKMSSNLDPIFSQARSGDPVRSVANIQLSKDILEFRSRFTIEQMIDSCL